MWMTRLLGPLPRGRGVGGWSLSLSSESLFLPTNPSKQGTWASLVRPPHTQMVFPVDVLFFTTSLSLLTSSVRQDARGFFLFLKGRTWGSMKSADTAMVTNQMLEPSFVAFGVQMSWPYTFLLYRLGRGAVAKERSGRCLSPPSQHHRYACVPGSADRRKEGTKRTACLQPGNSANISSGGLSGSICSYSVAHHPCVCSHFLFFILQLHWH